MERDRADTQVGVTCELMIVVSSHVARGG